MPGSRRRQARPGFSFGRRVSAADLSLLTRQIATLVRAALPLEEALLAVSQQTEKPRVQSILLGVRAKVVEGHTLAAGLAEFPRVFPEIYRATVSAGEETRGWLRVVVPLYVAPAPAAPVVARY